ncbi:MAG: hypothetical protein Q4G40_06555 [Brachybacterium sp.]|nr:hypothetical protein [Brachybacterium sp.]
MSESDTTPYDELDAELGGDPDRHEVEGIEPGADAPVGSGIEGADDILEAERDHDPDDGYDETARAEDAGYEDDSAAAEQGNRDGDEMVSEGDDAREVDELAGDDLDVDAIGGDRFTEPQIPTTDLDGDDLGELSGETPV